MLQAHKGGFFEDFCRYFHVYLHFNRDIQVCIPRIVLYLQLISARYISPEIRQWGCFGFDSIRHWTVSTPGSVGQPVNLDLQTISWQQLLCTRCVVCKAHYLNPRGQGYLADEYPSSL